MGAEVVERIRGLLRRQVDLDRVLDALVGELSRAHDAERATLYLVDHGARQLVSRVAQGLEISEIRLRLGEGIAGVVGQDGQPIRLGERDEDPRWSRRTDVATGYRTRNMLCVPVRDAGGTVVAVLQVLNKRGGDFGDDDLRRLEDHAAQIALLLDDTSLRGQLRPDHDKPLSFRFNFIVGDSAVMRTLYERIGRAAGTEATVLLLGETGTGKELLARAIHFNSPRRRGPFVKIDCAALPESLVENELFGHERGAFTGADAESEGKVASAEGGTLFLDEVGELPLSVQGKLLRLLQERVYLRVGGARPRHASVRFVAATHRDLQRDVAEGRFRADLYYRLRVVQIDVPPLRARGHVDLDRLVDHFFYELTRQHGRPELRLAPETRAALHAHPWPGNVRELEHCIESMVVLAEGPVVGPELLPSRGASGASAEDGGAAFVLRDVLPLREAEARYVRHVLALCEGNRTRAARRLGIGRNTLLRKLDPGGD